jgi:tRNA(Ile)-lysidine synthase
VQAKNNMLPQSFKSPALLSGLDADTPILVGLSGGADSSALLHMLCSYSIQSGAKIYAAHVNHGIRGEEADRDERFCREFADALGVKLFVLRADVPKIAVERGESVETAARGVRYSYFEQIMREQKIPILATAHNANDNIETVIFNIARGSGLGGVCGIPECRPTKQGIVIRPILSMDKNEILDYCKQNSISFVTDSTNVDTDYTRNLIRSEIIPVMQRINSGAIKNATRMSQSLREDSLCLESMAGWFIEELRDGYSIEIEKLCGSPPSIVNRALIRLYDELTGGKTLEQTHINSLRELAVRAVPHSSVSLPGGIEGVIENGKLCLCPVQKKVEFDDYSVVLCEGSNLISQTNTEIFIGNSQNAKNVYKKSIVLYIDSAKIRGELFARSRKSGDSIRTHGMHKSFKKLLCEKKIPLELRARLPIICDSDGVVAVPFVAMRDGMKADQNSDLALAIHIYFYE